MQLLGPAMVAWQPGDVPPARQGSRIDVATPRNVYRTRDGRWVVISGPTDNQVRRILELMGHDTDDARAKFGHAAERNAHNDELDGLVAEWVATLDAHDVVDTLVERAHPGHRGQRHREPARRRCTHRHAARSPSWNIRCSAPCTSRHPHLTSRRRRRGSPARRRRPAPIRTRCCATGCTSDADGTDPARGD